MKTAKLFSAPFSSYNQFIGSFTHGAVAADFSHYLNEIEKSPFINQFLDFLPYRITITNYQTQQYLYVNEMDGLTGYKAKEFLEKGMPFFISRIHPDDMQEIADNSFPKLLAKLNKFSVEEIKEFKISYTYRFKRKDNVWVKFLQHYIILEMDENRNPLLLLNMVSDITLYKKDDAVLCTISHSQHANGLMNMITEHFNAHINTSCRENEIITCIANGLEAKEIAAKLNLSTHTIQAHKKNIFIKTKTKNIAQLTSYAIANGII